MIYFHWIYLLLYVVITVPAIITVLMDNRQPAKTMAWILVFFFIPFVGIIFYFFFGQNTRKERLISDRSMDQLTKRSMLEFVEQENLHLPDSNKTLMNLFANQSWALPFKDNQVDIYTDGYDFFLTLLYNIGQAKHHIHLDTYIFEADALGYLIADALIDKAEQGVEVRLIYDDVGCWKVKDEFFERMRDAGIDIHSFMPVRFPAFTSKVNYRNHRKLCVIDGKVGFIGGMNIALRYVKGDKKQAWRDTHLLPVTWKNGWPEILAKNTPISTVGEKAGLKPAAKNEFSGNFSYVDNFDADNNKVGLKELNPRWMFLRDFVDCYKVENGKLKFNLLPGNIYKREPMSAIWARQQHGTFTAETEINFTPRNDKDIAGLALLQKEDHNFVLGKTMKNGKLMITLTRAEKNNVTIASAPIKGGKLKLKVEGHDRYYDFYYAEEGGNWQLLAKGVDASNLSTQKSGGFLGACIGLYASSNKE